MFKIIVNKKDDRPDCTYCRSTLAEAMKIAVGQKKAYCESVIITDTDSGTDVFKKVFTN